MPRRAVFLLALLLAAIASPAPAPAQTPKPVTHAVKKLRRGIAHTPRTALPHKSRAAKRAKKAGRDFKRGNYCRGLQRLNTIPRIKRLSKRIGRVEIAVARTGRAGCVAPTKTTTTTPAASTGEANQPADPVPADGGDENDQGEELPPLPAGPFRPGTATGDPTDAGDVQGRSAGRPKAIISFVSDAVSTFAKTDLGASSWTGSVQDPSTASAGNVVLVSTNRFLYYSTDAGSTFKSLDPTTLGWPKSDGGICCDQVLQYSPKVKRFFWLIQFNCNPGCDGNETSENRYRLAVATPAQVSSSGATHWTYYDFTSDTFNQNNQWMDFPDMSLGLKNLYFTFDLPRSGSAVWARYPLKTMAQGKTVSGRYWFAKDHYVLKTVQNPRTTGIIAERKDDSDFEVSTWPDNSDTVTHHKVGFATPPTQNCGENDPDGVNFLSMFDCAGFSSRIGGAARASDGNIWLAWTAGKRVAGAATDLFAHSHIQLLTIDPSTFKVTRDRAIWNPDYSWSYPGLSAGQAPGGEVAMSYFTGGGTAKYPNMGVGFVSNKESFVRVATGAKGKSRMGDYVTVRPQGTGPRYTAASYIIDANGKFHPWWTLFGRSSDTPPPVLTPTPVVTPTPPPPTPTPTPSPTPTPFPTVTRTPTPVPTPVPRPDFIVTAANSTEQTGTSITVQNAGTAAATVRATASVVGRDGNNGSQTLTFTIPALAVGASATLTSGTPTYGSYVVTADSTNIVVESDENNNTRTGIGPAPFIPPHRAAGH